MHGIYNTVSLLFAALSTWPARHYVLCVERCVGSGMCVPSSRRRVSSRAD